MPGSLMAIETWPLSRPYWQVTGKEHGWYNHETEEMLVLHIDRRVYVSEVDDISWTQVNYIGAKDLP